MIEIKNIDKFILKSIQKIDEEYFCTIFTNTELFEPSLRGRVGEFINDDFYYYGERIFCYELYHQLRLGILKFTKKNLISDNLKIQGEARKMNIINLLDNIGLDSFSTDKIPDLIIHSPTDSENQLCIIEVKCKGNLTQNELYTDLKKLDIYCNSLKFENAYFISINSSCKHIENLISDLDINEFNCANKIKIICMENSKSNPKIRTLN